ncbi:MAG TPA: CoB--CoM heterodisulfide reductase iron-sulfur subunit B family protein [Anaerolineales bacterium]|nr:CoB--CoM heterodisulfide reductase iron-sulfur subunit B family protein [Anaerolineales bacterium]
MRYGYYPGCSLTHSAAAYDLSARAVAGAFALELDEIHDWNCCGATEYITIHKSAAYALVGRNLALAEAQDGIDQLVAPCSACYLNLRKVDHNLGLYPELEEHTNAALAAGGLHYDPGSLRIRHLLDVVVDDVGLEAVAAKVTRPLAGLRLAPYYGCLLVRPSLNGDGADTEYPTHLDRLLRKLGAEVVDYPLKTHCCGGHMTQISADTAYELIRRLLDCAQQYQADAIVTACPMCQLNLDAYQSQVNRRFGTDFHLPVLYFTQMIGLALGMVPAALGFGQEIVPAEPALAKIGAAVPETEPASRHKRAGAELPMPRRRGED